MLTNGQITRKAREALRGNWVTATAFYLLALIIIFVVTFLLEFIFAVPEKVSGFLALGLDGAIVKYFVQYILEWMILSPIIVGIFRLFYHAAERRPILIQDIFHGFKWECFWRNNFTILMERFVETFFGLLMGIPCVLGVKKILTDIFLGSNFNYASPMDIVLHGTSLHVGAFVALFIFTFFCIFIVPALNAIYYIIATHREIGVLRTFQTAFTLVNCHRAKYWRFYSRFFFWYVPSFTLFLVATFAKVPAGVSVICYLAAAVAALIPTVYMLTASIIFFRELEKDYVEKNPGEAANYMADFQ